MLFKVCSFPGVPDFETLHAAKLIEFPLEQRDYKPFSQARICFSEEGLHVQMHCFESESLAQSAIHAYLQWTPQLLVQLSIFAGGESLLLANGEPIQQGQFVPFTGEDLQGVYWGGTFTVPTHFFEERLGHYPGVGETFRGNFYKVCDAPEKPHYGSFFPADFSKGVDAPENFGEFLLIAY